MTPGNTKSAIVRKGRNSSIISYQNTAKEAVITSPTKK